MDNCYRFKNINYNSGIFDNFVDMTYVLLMENSKREKHVYNELNLFKPTKNVKIQYNRGFKNCSKDLCEQKSNWDIIHSTYNIFLDSIKNNYKNILILEDDFIVNNIIFDKYIIQDLKDIINNVRIDILLLGIFTSYIITQKSKIYKCGNKLNIPCGGTQGYIINYDAIVKFIKLYEMSCKQAKIFTNNGHIDWFYNSKHFDTYFYYKPLIIQPLEETENKKTSWNNLLSNIYIYIFNFNNTNKKELVKSYELLYKSNYFIIYILLILILIIIYLILYFI